MKSLYITLLVIFLSINVLYANGKKYFIPKPQCGISRLSELEKEIKNIPIRSLTKKELSLRDRISLSGAIKYDTLGQKESFWNILNSNTWQRTPATCRKVTNNAYFYVADDVWYEDQKGYVTQKDIDDIAETFSTKSKNVYDRSREVFGKEEETGIDGDPHITIFLMNLDNDEIVSNPNWNVAWLGGYSTIIDKYPDGTNNMHSNERKIIYIDTYPTFEHGKAIFDSTYDSVQVVDSTPTINHNDDQKEIVFTEGPDAVNPILAHEFQHKIHSNYDTNEEKWLDEGCSELSPIINNFGPQKGHLKSFFENSNDNLLIWDDSLRDYGEAMLFLTYLYDHFGGDSFIFNLVRDKETGVDSINSNLSKFKYSNTFKSIFGNWTIANYYNDTTLSDKYAYKSIDLFDTTIFVTSPKKPNIARYGMNPIKNYLLKSPMAISDVSIAGYSGIYYSFVPFYNSTRLNIAFSGDENGSNWSSSIGIRKAADSSLKIYDILLESGNAGEINIFDFDSSHIKEAVLIVTNIGDEDKKFSFTCSIASGDSPFAPINLTASAGEEEIELNWDENKEAVKNINNYESTAIDNTTYIIKYFSGYNIYRSEQSDGVYSQIASLVSKIIYTDKKLNPQKKYYYKITAVNAKYYMVNDVKAKVEYPESAASLYAYAETFEVLKQQSRNKCFMSDAVIKDEMKIKSLLRFRDKYLFNNIVIKKAMELYYYYSPQIMLKMKR